jgi:UDP-N-acetylglucosamine acyltransferase
MGIHPTAIVNNSSNLGAGVTIGPYAVVERDTQIAESNEVRAHAVIKRFTSLGPANIIHEGAVLGGEPQDLGFDGSESYLRIGARNKIRESATLNRGTQPGSETVVGSDCFIMAYAHIAHNCIVGDGVIIANSVALAGHIDIEDNARISGGVVIHQFCRIGQLAMVGGNSKIVQDCLPFVITDGIPGRACGLNVVGLRRAGFDSGQIQKLKQGYRFLLRAGLKLEAAIDSMRELQDPLVDQMIGFVLKSERGFCHQ